MLYETVPQAAEFAAMVLCGVGMGLVGLLFRGLRRLMQAGFRLSLLCDLLMGTVWAALACAALTVICWGQARLFHFFAMICGMLLLRGAVSGATCSRIGNCAARIRKTARRLLSRPVLRWLLR